MSETASEPSFVGEMLNMTVPVGRDVDLDCQVKNAEGYKVKVKNGSFPCFGCGNGEREREEKVSHFPSLPDERERAFRSPFVRQVKSRPCPSLPCRAASAAPHPLPPSAPK